MRIVIKNANFSVYGMNDIAPLIAEIEANYGGIGNKIGVVRNLLIALGADGSNNIWPKIKYLYMPVLAVPADGAKALYDIIGKENYPGVNYTIEVGRGVGPNTMGGNIGNMSLPSGLVDDTSISGFCIVTQSARQTLGNSSGGVASFGGLVVNWQRTGVVFTQAGGSSVAVATSTAFNVPQTLVFSKKVDGSRTIVGREATNTTAAAKTTDILFLAGADCWADISVMGLCDGLTPEEASVVNAALDTFINDFGISCANG